MTGLTSWPAPAKLNLMLQITGRRSDGYHNLQSLFQFLDFCDQLSFTPSVNGDIRLIDTALDFPAEHNLVYKAARLLQQRTGCAQGADIHLQKRIPMGAGLGGGSSDAATTLIALNRIWQTGLTTDELAALGLQLGADVPVFVRGHAAWAEGVGEQLTAVNLPELWFVVITPSCSVSTAQIFSHKELTRNSSPITIAAALEHGGRNDCEPLVRRLYPEVDRALNWLNQFAAARLTGTGSSVFAQFATKTDADDVLAKLPPHLSGFAARGLNLSPLHQIVKIDAKF